MRLLLDTHLLLWASFRSAKLSPSARALIGDEANDLLFSAASIWEVAIKRGLARDDFEIDPGSLRSALLAQGYAEMVVTGAHAATVAALPPLHKDPFDRLLVAQSLSEPLILLTRDARLTRYGTTIRVV